MGSKKKQKYNKKLNTIITIIVFIIAIVLTIEDLRLEKQDSVEAVAEENQKEENKEFTSEDDLKVYFIDVGQADSILITNKAESMLIDAGNNSDGKKVVNFIKDKGIKDVKYVVGTHPHEDHIGGLDDVINAFNVKNVFLPKVQTNTKTFEDVLIAIKNKKLKITSPKTGDTFKIGDSNCEVMSAMIDEDNLNVCSIVIRLEYGNKSFLFTGDAETKNESAREWPKTDVLKVGHHGSSTSSSKRFLDQINPEYAIIMSEKGNDYGHPHKEVLKRLEKIGTKIYRTDENGTITAICDGNNIDITTEKQ